jgi:hypothetical protein
VEFFDDKKGKKIMRNFVMITVKLLWKKTLKILETSFLTSPMMLMKITILKTRKNKKKLFEAQLKIKKRKPIAESDEHPVRNIFNQTNFNQETVDKEYMQLFDTNNPSHQRLDSNKVPELMCFLQAYFVLLFSMCKTLDEQVQIISKFSMSSPGTIKDIV